MGNKLKSFDHEKIIVSFTAIHLESYMIKIRGFKKFHHHHWLYSPG